MSVEPRILLGDLPVDLDEINRRIDEIDGSGGTFATHDLVFTPAAAESPTEAEVAAELPEAAVPGDIAIFRTGGGVTHTYDVIEGKAARRRHGPWLYRDGVPSDASFRADDEFDAIDSTGILYHYVMTAAAGLVRETTYPDPGTLDGVPRYRDGLTGIRCWTLAVSGEPIEWHAAPGSTGVDRAGVYPGTDETRWVRTEPDIDLVAAFDSAIGA